MGIGTPKGGRIPLEGTDGFLRDRDGNIVVTKLNEAMAQGIATAGNGTYIRVDNTNSAQEFIENELDTLTKDEVKTEVFTKFKEQFGIIALLAFLLLITDIVVVGIVDIVNSPKRKSQKN